VVAEESVVAGAAVQHVITSRCRYGSLERVMVAD